MPISDYSHHDEEAMQIWWLEEGQHHGHEEPPDYDPDDDHDWYGGEDPEHYGPEDCVRDSCWSLKTATGCWECDICGRLHLGMNPQARRAGINF